MVAFVCMEASGLSANQRHSNLLQGDRIAGGHRDGCIGVDQLLAAFARLGLEGLIPALNAIVRVDGKFAHGRNATDETGGGDGD